MASANSTFLISELDFDGIRGNLLNYYQNQSLFNSYNFNGAALAFLLDNLSYNAHYMAFYLNMLASEMFLDSAQIRDSIVSRAKAIGYTPTSMRAATSNVQIIVSPPSGNTQSSLLLPIYTEFQSEAINGINYTFVTNQSYTATKNLTSNTFTFPGVTLYQGESFSYSVSINNTNLNSIFTIPSANLDTTTLIVQVQPTSMSTQLTTFTQAVDITLVNANSNVYYLQATTSGQYGIQFGDGFLGEQLSNGNIVIINYIATDGQASNFANTYSISGSIGSFSNVAVTTNALSAGGAQSESNESIKFRAPISYTRQNRAVTTDDYSDIIPSDFPNISQVAVWGGEDNVPPVYGSVFISMVPKPGYVITDAEQQNIIDSVVGNRSVVTVTPVIVDPNYLYLKVLIDVYYDPSRTSLSSADLETLVYNQVVNYTQSQLGTFNSIFSGSVLSTSVNSLDTSIISNDLKVFYQTRFTPTLNVSTNYTLNYNAALNRAGPGDLLYSYPGFIITDPTGISQVGYIEEVPLSVTGIHQINVIATGQNYTTIPEITIVGDGSGATAVAIIQNGKLIAVNVITPGIEYTTATILIGGPGTGAAAIAVLSQQFGQLQTYYLKPDGTKIILNPIAGIIDYVNGTITLTNFNPSSILPNPNYSSGVLTMNVEEQYKTILPFTNRIVVLDPTDPTSIQITMKPVTT